MSRTNTKNKLARNNKLANTPSSSRTQFTLVVDEENNVKQQEKEVPASPASDTQMEATKDSSFLSIDDLMLSQSYNPNSDVTWQIASPEVLRKIHKAIMQNQKMRKNKCKTLNKDEIDSQQATEVPKINTPAIVRPKKRIRMKKKFSSNIENTIKTIEMKIKSDEYLASSDTLSSQRNLTSSSSSPSHSEACHLHSSEHYSNSDKDSCHLDDITQKTSDDDRESRTHLLSSEDCKNVDEEVAWSEDELLNDSLVETALINSCMDNLKENSFKIQYSNAKVQSPKIQNNLKDSNQSSSKKKSLNKRKTPSKIQKVIFSENASSVSEDMDLSDSEIDEMLSQLQETDFVKLDMSESTVNTNSEIPPQNPVALDVEQFHDNRVTRSMVKKASVHQVNQKPLTKSNNNRTNECDTLPKKVYFLRNLTTPKTENSACQHIQFTPKRGEDLFDDSEITDELLVDIYEDIFKDDMEEADNSTVANQKKGPHSSAKDISEQAVPKTKNQVCSKEEIERKKLEALKRRKYRSETKRK